MSDILIIHDLVKSFGGIRATDHISLRLERGEIHAIIGPNGAGKTTLINQLCGEIPSDSGSVILEGELLDGLSFAERAAKGMGRTFQITQILGSYSVRENVVLAARSHLGQATSLWRDLQREQLVRAADSALDRVAWDGPRDQRAADLSHGEQKRLELAMALALEPKLFLLDEPMAGLGPAESARMIETLRAFKGQVTMLLVEHDMDAVFALADRISVLVYGRIIATGTPAEIRANADVRIAYLGEGDA